MLRLICGPSASGKTAEVIRSIREDLAKGVRCYLLVPEQQAYISERDFTRVLPSNAGLLFETVSFSGLAEEVFRAFGGITRPEADGGIRSFLMWETLRELAPLLKRYGRSARGDTALTAEMLAAVEELRHNGIDAEMLEKAANGLPQNAPLREKLSDLAAVDTAFRIACKNGFGDGISDRLQRLSELLSHNDYFKGCHIYVDSFSSFTVPEYAVLRELLRVADLVTVTLCADRPLSKKLHFESLSRTASRLLHLANEVGAETSQTILQASADQKPTALRAIERDLWNFELRKSDRELPAPSEPTAVRCVTCANLYEEAEACALNILELVQNGMRYGEIAAVVRDTDTYKGVLDAAFERHGIPYFLSERTELSEKPLIRLILSALRATSKGYRTQDILTLLKTGLGGAELRDVSLFEEYCETWHITGNRFFDHEWNMNPDGLTDRRSERADGILEAANRVRAAVMTPLLHLHAAMKASDKLSDRCRAVYDYLCRLDVQKQLSERAKAELSLGQRREAGDTVRLYRFTVESLTTLSALFPELSLTEDEFLSALTLFFQTTDLGSVPNVQDCVTIGSASTLRVENVNAAFLLGLCEGEFPKAVTDDGLLSEAEKDTLSELGLQFDSRRGMRSSEEMFYVYRAMTKPRKALILSYPSMQPDGSSRAPSLAFTRVCYLLNLIPEVFDASVLRKAEMPRVESSTTDLQAAPLPEGTVLRLSQSSVKRFALCPYSYYAQNLLKLRERADSTVGANDEGTFLHFVFEQFLRACLDKDGVLQLPAPEALEPTADAIIEDYLARVCPIPPDRMDLRLLHLFARLRGLALLMLQSITAELRTSLFRPALFEQYIGSDAENGLPAVEIPLANGSVARLTGLIDRVDLYEHEGALYVRVVDYKTGKHEFSFRDVRAGTDIQLILYLFAVVSRNPERFRFGGAHYLFSTTEEGRTKIDRSGVLLRDDAILNATDTDGTGIFTKSLTQSTEDEIRALTSDMLETVRSIGERILSGEATKTPSPDACRYCSVRAHCGVACHEKN